MSNSFFNDFCENLEGLICRRLANEVGSIQHINQGCFKMLGYSETECISEDFGGYKKLFTQEDWEIYKALIDKLISKKETKIDLQYQFLLKNKTKLWVRERGKIHYADDTETPLYIDCLIVHYSPTLQSQNILLKYKLLTEATEEAIILHQHGKIIETNKALTTILGYSAEEIIGKNLLDLLASNNEVQANTIAAVKEAITKDDQIHSSQLELIHKNGHLVYVVFTGHPIRIDGEIYRYVVVKDISKSIKIQQELEQSQQKYKRLSDATNELILIHDNGIILEANQAFYHFLGYVEEEIIGLHTINLIDPDVISANGLTPEMLSARYLSNESFEGINYMFKKNGERFVFYYKETPFVNNNRTLRQTIMRDITEEQEMLRKLEESQQMYKRLADITSEAIVIHKDGVIKEVNKATCKIFGLEDETDFIGKKTIDFILDTEFLRLSSSPEEVLELYATQKNLAGTLRYKKADGTFFSGQYTESVIEIEGESYRYTIIRDISAELESQRKLEESRNKYKLFADLTQEAIVIHGPNGFIKEVNSAYCQLFEVSEENAIGKTGFEFIPNDEIDKLLSLLAQGSTLVEKPGGAAPQPLGSITVRFLKSTGQQFIADTNTSYISVDGELLRYTVIRDITKNLESEQKLRESNEKYKRLADATREGIIIHEDGIIREVNQSVCKLFSYNEQDLVNQNIHELIELPTYAETIQDSIFHTGENNSTKIDRMLLRKSDGSSFVAELWENKIEVNERLLRYTVIRDITERIRYEQRIEDLVYNLSEKNKQLNCLLDISQLSTVKSYSLDEVLEKALELIPPSWQFPEICCACIFYSQKNWCTDNYQESPWEISAPIIVDETIVGSIKVNYIEECPMADEGPFLSAERALINTLGIQLGSIIEKKKSEEKVISSILATEDRERTRIAKELHESLGQLLTAISLNLESLKKDIDSLSPKNQTKLTNTLKHLGEAILESRNLSHNIMPKTIKDYGYKLAVESMIESLQTLNGIQYHFYTNLNEERLSSKLELALYRITQEALTNILKHASATHITIQLMKYDDMLMLSIEDNGIGFNYRNVSELENSLGLHSIKNRANSVSGHLSVESQPGMGTNIIVEIPL